MQLGIGQAIIVGHSFGAARGDGIRARPTAKRRAASCCLSAATHPWPGGATSWYYSLTAMPVVGRLFAATLAYPAGTLRLPQATACVFSPNKVPDGYADIAVDRAGAAAGAFRANAIDVAGLYRHARATAPRYHEIAVPTVVISGDMDTVVDEQIHSIGLARDIKGAELVWVRNLGHKPDWIAPELVVAGNRERGRRQQRSAGAGAARRAADRRRTLTGSASAPRRRRSSRNWRRYDVAGAAYLLALPLSEPT